MPEDKNNYCSDESDENKTGLKAKNHDKWSHQTTLHVKEMDCPDEIAIIERSLKRIEGIVEIQPNLMGGTVLILHGAKVTPQILINAIAAAGLIATEKSNNNNYHKEVDLPSQSKHKIPVLVSGILIGIGIFLQWQNLFAPIVQIAIFALAIIWGGWSIFTKAIRSLKQFALDMNVLMTVAVIGASAIGEWSEGASVVFLFGLAELLESMSIARAKNAIQSLLKLTPDTAIVKRGDQFLEVKAVEVKVSEIINVKSGARVPLDGVVITGKSSINQAPITGESMPVEKQPGDLVFAGTINGEGSLDIKVTKEFKDTTISKIIRLVSDAESKKAPSQRFVDSFAKIYTPLVFILAIIVLFAGPLLFNGGWLDWFYKSLVLLVIACPCALVISTPVSIVSGLTAMARRGILIKGGSILEEVGKLKAIAVDKTGTITEGQPLVSSVTAIGLHKQEKVVSVAASIDVHSDHPLAQAVIKYATKLKINLNRSENYQAITGKGALGEIDKKVYFVGNHRLAHEFGSCTPEIEKILVGLEDLALSVVIVGLKSQETQKGEVLGIIAIGDTIRTNVTNAVRALHQAGVEKIMMLSGDNQRTVNAIAKQAGIDEAYGELLPENKVERIKKLISNYKFVGMIGDGVNDAPAMATATIGIAMGGAGTDTAIEVADITLMNDDLSKVAEAVLLGRRTVRIIKVNISFSLLVKAVFLVLALTGNSSLWLAIFADAGATLIVIANSLRLLRN